MKLALRKLHGFTLIELLVATSVMSLVFVIGFAGFRDYSRRQQLTALARQLQGELRNAQELALSGTKPAACVTPLDGYKLEVVPTTSYTVSAVCSGAAVSPALKTITIPTGYTISAPRSVMFKPLGQGTDLTVASSNFTISQTSGGLTTTVTVTSGGEIK